MKKTTGEPRREGILAAAESLLQREGYRRTTIAGIAKEAQISVGSVYLEFDSKDAIVAELARRCHFGVLARMQSVAAVATDPVSALRTALEARVLAQHEHARAHPHALELFHCHACSGVARAIAAVAPAELRFVSELLERGEREGAFELIDRADVVAGTLLRLLERLGPVHEHALKGRSLSQEVTRACELLIGGLRRPA